MTDQASSHDSPTINPISNIILLTVCLTLVLLAGAIPFTWMTIHASEKHNKKKMASVLSQGRQLMQEGGCFVCHQENTNLVGPSLVDISKKYSNNLTTVNQLSEKVKKGGVGAWGQVAMPPQTLVSDENLKTIIQWILLGEYDLQATSETQGIDSYLAQNSQKLIEDYGCTACHQTAQKSVGPSYQQIATKYQNTADAARILAQRTKQGSVGIWGDVALMPPQGHVSIKDLHMITQWILSQKP